VQPAGQRELPRRSVRSRWFVGRRGDQSARVPRRRGLHRRVASASGHRLQRYVASLWPSVRSPPACRGTPIGG